MHACMQKIPRTDKYMPFADTCAQDFPVCMLLTVCVVKDASCAHSVYAHAM
jgi:hypothetical protein